MDEWRSGGAGGVVCLSLSAARWLLPLAHFRRNHTSQPESQPTSFAGDRLADVPRLEVLLFSHRSSQSSSAFAYLVSGVRMTTFHTKFGEPPSFCRILCSPRLR